MRPVFTVKLIDGSHHDKASGNSYHVVPPKMLPSKDGSLDVGTVQVPGEYPVFKTGRPIWETFRNKFQRVTDDTPTTHPPDGTALEAMAANEAEEKLAAHRVPSGTGNTPTPTPGRRRRG